MTRALRFYTFMLGVALVSRGVDYSTGDEFHEVTPILAWGIACLVVGLVTCVSAFAKRWQFPYFSCIAAFAVYVMIAVQRFEVDMLPYPWPPDGNRVFVDLFTFGALSLSTSITIQYRESVKAKKRQKIEAADRWLAGELQGGR